MGIGTEVTFSHSTNGDIKFVIVGKDLDGPGTTTLVAASSIGQRKWHSYVYSKLMYPNSEIRSWLNGTFYNGFSEADRAKIIPVTKVSKDLYRSGEVTSTEYVWLLSAEEVINTYKIESVFRDKYGSIEPFAGRYNGSGGVLGPFLRDIGDYEDNEVCVAANSQGSIYIDMNKTYGWSERMTVPGIVV